MEAFVIEASFSGLCQMACVLIARINSQFTKTGSGNFRGAAGLKKQTDLYLYKCRSKSQTSSTFSFNRLSNSNAKVLTIYEGF